MPNINLTTDEEIHNEMALTRENKNIHPSLETEKMSERKLVWPEFDFTIDDKFEIINLNRSNLDLIEKTAWIYRLGFPELFCGVYEDLHFPQRYANLLGEKKIMALKNMQNGDVASAWCLSPSDLNMSVEFSLTVTNPEYRGQGLCRKFTKIIDKVVEKAGTELGIVYCATFHTATQKIFTEVGFEMQALLRGFVVANAGDGKYARDNVVLYTKLYNQADRLCPQRIELMK